MSVAGTFATEPADEKGASARARGTRAARTGRQAPRDLMTTTRRRLASGTTVLLAVSVLSAAAGAATERVWSYTSAADTSVPREAALGDGGTLLFCANDGGNGRVRLLSAFDTDPPQPVWEYVFGTDSQLIRVAAAAQTDRFAAILQQPDATNPLQRRAHVLGWTSASGTPAWSRADAFPFAFYPQDDVYIVATPDGSRIVASVFDPVTMKTATALLDGASGATLAFAEHSTFGPISQLLVSDDGGTVVLANGGRLTVLAGSDLSLVDTTNLYGTVYDAFAVSADGRRIAYGQGGELVVLERQIGGTNYSAVATLSPGGESGMLTALDLTPDGGTAACGFVLSGGSPGTRLVAFAIDSGAVLADEVQHSQGVWSNWIVDVRVSDDGAVAAMGAWGDVGGDELAVLHLDGSAPPERVDLAGSVMALDLSPDGLRVGLAAKSVHANEVGGGGSYQLFRTRTPDVEVRGAPRFGGDVEVRFRPTSGPHVFLAVAGFPSTPPAILGGTGTLYLERQAVLLLSMSPLGDGWYTRDLSLLPGGPLDPAPAIGSEYWLQGFSSSPRKLSDDFVRLRVLP